MKHYVGILALVFTSITLVGCGGISQYTNTASTGSTTVIISTQMGDMEVMLYDSTPTHRDNFLSLVDEGYYNDLLFHRVISGFMIQGGDPESRNAPTNKRLGTGGPEYKIDAEIGELHYKGTLAAARQGDAVNPTKQSSGSQFYIVQGTPQTEDSLQRIATQKGITYSPEQIARYVDVGGTPMLDNDYTVFGEVVVGFELIDALAGVPTGSADRPIQDVTMTITRK